MDWIIDNLAVVSSSLVAIISVVISLIKLVRESDASSKKVERIVGLTDAYVKMPQGIKAKSNMETILNIETEKFKIILTRKVNVANVVAVIFISAIGGLTSYYLAQWAISLSGFWAAVIWFFFGLVASFTMALAITGVASTYKHEDKKGEK